MAKKARKAKKPTKPKAAAAAEPSQAAINRARPIVMKALGFPGATDTTKLADIGFDQAAMAGLAADIRDAGVNINAGAITFCPNVLCVIKAVALIKG